MDVDLNACMQGDKAEWDRFVHRYARIIVAAVRRTLAVHGARGDVDDPVQDVFVRLVKDDYRLLRSYDPQRAALATWLTLVARSTTIDHLRRRRREPLTLEDQAPPAAPDPAGPGPVEVPLHLLTGRQRLVLRLLFDEERTVPEAAAFLGVDEQTVRSTKHKALERLRAHYRTEDRTESPGMPPEARA